MAGPQILLVLDESPYPITNGGRMDFFYHARSLLRLGCRVALVFPYSYNEDYEQFLLVAPDICTDFYAYPRAKRRISGLFNRTPYILLNRKPDKATLQGIREKFLGWTFDLIIEGNLNAHVLAQTIIDFVYPGVVRLHRMHNLETTLLWSTFKSANFCSSRKWFFALEAIKMWLYEKNIYSSFENIAAISIYEQLKLKKKYPHKNVFWLPPFFEDVPDISLDASETDQFNRIFEKLSDKRVALIVGNFYGGMTVDEVRWFLEEVFPRITRFVADFAVVIAGRDAGSHFHSTEGVHVVSNYASIKPLMALSELFVVTTTGRGGVKLKLMEALSYGKPVVSTTNGVFGSGLENVLPNTDDPEKFAEMCISILNTADSQKEALDFFAKRFNCGVNARQVVDLVLLDDAERLAR